MSFINNGELAVGMDNLIKSGIIVNVDESIQFSSPIIRQICILYTMSFMQVPLTNVSHTSLAEFMVIVLGQMRPSILKNTYGVSKSDMKPLESVYTMELYHAISKCLRPGTYCSPEVGYTFGLDGKFDFYINGNLKWAIEVLREGDRTMKHYNRFQPQGIYFAAMQQFINEYLVIDFRSDTSTIAATPKENLWYVCYDRAFTRFTIHVPSSDLKCYDRIIVPLVGDYAQSVHVNL